jgi:hypothetical protein
MVLWDGVVKSWIIRSLLVLHRFTWLHISILSFFIWRAKTSARPLLDRNRMEASLLLSLRIMPSLWRSLIRLVSMRLLCVIGLIKAAGGVVLSIEALIMIVKLMFRWTVISILISLLARVVAFPLVPLACLCAKLVLRLSVHLLAWWFVMISLLLFLVPLLLCSWLLPLLLAMWQVMLPVLLSVVVLLLVWLLPHFALN